MILDSLDALTHEISAVQGWQEHCVFGSTALSVRHIIDREPDDVDAFVTKRVWGTLLARPGWRVETPNAGDPPILTLDTPNPLHLFYDWRDEKLDIDPLFLILTGQRVGPHGLRYATVEEVLRQKEAAYAWVSEYPKVAKHAPDVEACKQWIAAGNR